MRIWLLNPFDDIPGEGRPQRYWSLARVLSERGHEVVWWSSDWSHRRKARRRVDESALQDAGAFQLRLIEAPPYARNVGLARLRNHRAYAQHLNVEGGNMLESTPPDLVLCSWPPMGTAKVASEWRVRCGCKVVMDIMDAWPDNFLMLAPAFPGASAMMRLVLRPWFRQAHKAVQSVDALSAQSDTFQVWAVNKGSHQPSHVCYLGAWPLPPEGGVLSEPVGGVVRLLYLGAMGRVYDLETVIRAVALLLKEGAAVSLDLAGQGEQEANLHRLVEELDLSEQIRFHGYLEGEALQDLLGSVDIGVIPMRPESQVAVPYKAGEYLAAGLAIVNSLPGEMAQLMSDFDCGTEYVCGDIESMAGAIRLYLENSELLKRARINAGRLFKERFDRSNTYVSWAEWLEAVA
ncbi:glycosyltransferase family 4 protein [Cerasicoccus maritimus]|uniref:glycosyltransferase family 4 protein n=1 Tax=Cerasicoccus maritimus TaxID=490089 RepID=UPI00285257E4|nr:glycosyltransferase family 4 protein [Cerasicoccus maritimus]